MTVDGKTLTNEQAYNFLSVHPEKVETLVADAAESESFVTYSLLRSHHDYLKSLAQVRRS